MRIIHYLYRIRLSDGGVVRAMLDMATAMARAGEDVTVITFDAADVPWKPGAAGVPRVITLPPRGRFRGLVDPSVGRFLEPIVRQADIIHLHDLWDPIQVPLIRIARRLGIPYVQSPHGMLADWS